MLNFERFEKQDWQLFAIIYLSDSYVFCNDIMPSSITILLWVLLMCSLLLHVDKGNSFKTGLAFIVLLLLSSLYNNEEIIGIAKVIFSFVTSILFVQCYSFRKFSEGLIRIMYVVCVFAILGLLLTVLIPSLNNLNVTVNNAGNPCVNWYIFVKAQNSLRNFGIFWEPGGFQFYINIALLLYFFFKKEQDRLHIWIFIIALITTYSTTGYLTFIIILMATITAGNNSSFDKKSIILIALILSIAGYFYRDELFASSLSTGQSTVFGKITNFSSDDELTSASIRYYGILMPIRFFWDSPFLGHGINGLSKLTMTYTQGMNTCTFINWFAQFGLFYGLLAIVGISKLCSAFSKKWLSVFCVFASFFAASMSENFATSPFLLMLVLYGYQKNRCLI